MYTKRFLSVLIIIWVFFNSNGSMLFASDPENCLFCHKYRRLRVYDEEGNLNNYYVDTNLFHQSIHREVTCIGCHSDVSEVPHKQVEKVDCAKACHLERYKAITGYNFTHNSIAQTLGASIHGVQSDDPPEIAALKPDCKYCHVNDLYVLSEDIPSDQVLKRCFNCHKDQKLQEVFMHISHRFKHKTSRSPMEIIELCASCHDDKDFKNVVGFSGPQAEAVDTYKETIHYRILQLGGNDTAHCISCHSTEKIHDIRPASDLQSSIHPNNRYQTCQAEECHPGASPTISAVDSHLSKQKDKGPEIHIVEICMEAVMFATLFFLFALMSIETYGRLRNKDARFFRWRRKPQPLSSNPGSGKLPQQRIPNLHRFVSFNPKGDYKRYSIHVIINHTLMLISFTVATITGLPLFFHNAEFSHVVINFMGGIDVTRIIHRINAAVFALTCIYHVVYLVSSSIYKMMRGTFDVRRTQFPLLKDLRDLYFDMRYFLGLEKTRPAMEKFMYKQKVHYLAMIWGCTVLTISGCCLLFPEFMVQYIPFPKISVNVLRLMHAEESVLAFLVITFWHMYNVHVAPGRFPIQWTFWNGRITKDHQIEEHFLEYRRQVQEGVADSEEAKLLQNPGGTTVSVPSTKRSVLEVVVVFVSALIIAAAISGYLTFKVQFEKEKAPPIEKDIESSLQTLHVKDQERAQRHKHFHLVTEDINMDAWADKSACITCHSPFPHGKESKAKALMNLHTEFLTCNSCHIKIAGGEKIKFGWVNPTGISPQGEPYGTKLDPSTGLLAETDDHYSKMTPFKKINDTWEAIMPASTIDIELKPGDPAYMIKFRKLHVGVEVEEFVKCSSCHSPEGVLDFEELGFEPARKLQLERLEISGMFSNYETYYFPDFFREKFK